MTDRKIFQGHLVAFITAAFWGTCFLSTKKLLNSFSPIEILLFRQFFAVLILFALSPHRIHYKNLKEELMIIAAGICGSTFYFMFMNTALTYTLASNVGILTSISPFFTAVLSHFFLKDEKLHINFFAGFIISIIGIALLTFNGAFVLKLNPIGDILAILAAFVWGIYCVLMKKISSSNYNEFQLIRKAFVYGLIVLIPFLKPFDFHLDLSRFASIENIFNFIYIGVGASALCYVSWNYAEKILGAVKTSKYTYIIPIVSVVTSAIILHEKITITAFLGVFLILSGLYISEMRSKKLVIERIES